VHPILPEAIGDVKNHDWWLHGFLKVEKKGW